MVGGGSSFPEQSSVWPKKIFPTTFSTWHVDRLWHDMKIEYNPVGTCFLDRDMPDRKCFIFLPLQILVHGFTAFRIGGISENNEFIL